MYPITRTALILFLSIIAPFIGLSQKSDTTFVDSKTDGVYQLHYPDGTLMEQGTLANGRPTGTIKRYHPNGLIGFELIFEIHEQGSIEIVNNYWDVDGRQYIKDGEGYYLQLIGLGGYVKKMGRYHQGRRIGHWLVLEDGASVYTEMEFNDQFELVSNNRSTTYTSPILVTPTVQPSFKGGQRAWARHLGNYMKFPQKMKKAKLEGLVICAVVIDNTGDIKKAEAIESPHPAFSEEASRIISFSPDWNPATKDGKPVWSLVNMAVDFRLKRRR